MSTAGTLLILGALLGLTGLGCITAIRWSDRRPRRLTDAELADLARLRAPYAPARDDIRPVHVGPGRHRYDVATGSCAQAARWNSTTGQFNVLRDLNWSPDEQLNLRSVTT